MQFFANYKRFFLTLVFLGNTYHCSAEKPVVRIAVASNLYQDIRELAAGLQTVQPEGCAPHQVQVVAGATNTLALQIENKAPYHVFISADHEIARQLWRNGTTGKPVYLTTGVLVYWNRKVKVSNLDELAEQLAASKTALANPLTAPFGTKAAGIIDDLDVKPKMVQAASVQQVAALVTAGGLESAFVAATMLDEPTFREGFSYTDGSKAWQIEQNISLVNGFGPCLTESGRLVMKKILAQAPALAHGP